MGGELKGRRLPDGTEWMVAEPGDYWKPGSPYRQPNEWWFRDPFGKVGRILRHEVVEHPDGTITVRPSIAVQGGNSTDFHGWLTTGTWTW